MGDTITQAILDGRISLADAIAQHRPPTAVEKVQGAAKTFARSAVDALYSGNSALMRLESQGLDLIGAEDTANHLRSAADAMGGGQMEQDTQGVIGEPAPQLANQGFMGRALTQGLPMAAGSSLGMLAVPGPKGAVAGTAIKGALTGAGQGWYDAKLHGADDATAWTSFAANAALGATEAGIPGLPKTGQRLLGDILARADKATGGGLTKMLWNGVKTGFSEATQESLQQIGQNLVAKGLYDDDRKALEGMEPVLQGSALWGIVVGALSGGHGSHGAAPNGINPTTPTGNFSESGSGGTAPEGESGSAPGWVAGEGPLAGAQGPPVKRPRLAIDQIPPEAAAAVKHMAAGSQELGWQGTIHPVEATDADQAVRDFVERRGANLQLVESEDGQPLPRPAMYSEDGSVVVVDANAPGAFSELVDHEIGHHVLQNVEGQREAFQGTIDRLAPELRAQAAEEYHADLISQAQRRAGRDLTSEEIAQLQQQHVPGDEALTRIAEDFSPVVRLLRAKPEAFSVVDDVGFWRNLMRSVLDVGRSIVGKPSSQERALADVYRSVARTPLSSKIEPARGIEIAKAVKAFLDSAVGMQRPELGAPAVGAATPAPGGAEGPGGATSAARGSPVTGRETGGPPSPISEIDAISTPNRRRVDAVDTTRASRLLQTSKADLEQVHAQRLAYEDRALRRENPGKDEAWYQRVADLRRQARDPENPEGDRAAIMLRRAGVEPSGANVEEIEDALRAKAKAAAGPRGQFGQTMNAAKETVGQGPQYAVARRNPIEESKSGAAPPEGGVEVDEAAPGSRARGSEVRAAAIQTTDAFAKEHGAEPQSAYALYRRSYPISNGGSELTWDATDNAVAYWQNAWKSVKTWRDALAKAGLVTDRNDVYLKEELRRGKTKERQNVERSAVLKPLFDSVKASGLDLGDVELALMARAASDRNALVLARTGRPDGSGMSDAAAAKIMAGATHPAYADIFAKFDALTKRTRDLWVEYGLETREQVEAMEQAQPKFAPMRNDTEIEPVFGDRPAPRQGAGIQVRGREFKAALGRGSIAEYPLAYAASDLDGAIIRGEKNRVFQSAYELAKAQDDPRFALVDVPPMKETLVDGKVRKVPDFQLAQNEVQGKINGALRRIRFAPEWTRIADAMKNTGAENGGVLVARIGATTRTIAALSTRWNPIFPFVNAPRDFLSAVATTTAEHGVATAMRMFNPGTMAQAYKSLSSNDSWAQRFRDAGAPVSFMDVAPTPEKRAKSLQREIEDLRSPDSPWKMTRKYTAKVGLAIAHVNEIAENATRLAAFRGAVESGMSDERAASYSKNLTTNFERKGAAGWLNALYAFSNASIQGTARLGEAMKKPGARKLIAGMVAGAAMLDAMNRSFGGDDDDGVPYYDKIPEWIRSSNAIIMLPGTGGKRIQIPLPYGWGWFHTLGTEMARAVHDGDPIGATGRIMSNAFNQFDPLGGGDMLDTATPTVLRPLEQIERNQDWTGRRIYPDAHGPTPDSELAWDDTNPVMKDVARWLNSATGGNRAKSGLIDVSPITPSVLVKGFLGGAGGEAGRAAGIIDKAIQGDSIEFADVPLVRRYIGESSIRDQRAYWKQELDRVDAVAQQAKRGEDVSDDPLYRLRHRLTSWRERVSELDDQIRAAPGPDKAALRSKQAKIMLAATAEIRAARGK